MIMCFEDMNIQMNVESWGSRGNKDLVKIPSVCHLRYDEFRQNC